MTKFEWERQLKKGISGLPETEQKRVLDYYGELFSDKIDAGMGEEEIIAEFGNPFDIANKILVDFYNDGKENPKADEYIYSSAEKIDDTFDSKTNDLPPVKATVEGEDAKKDKQQKNGKKSGDISAKSASGLVAISCTLIFFVMGACFGLWHPGWMVFLLLPVVTSLMDAITKKNWRIFNYPVFVTFLFLAFGFGTGLWHPMWVLFLTIPLYYAIGKFVSKNPNEETKHEQKESVHQQKAVQHAEKVTKHTERKKSTGSNVLVGILVTVALVMVISLVWSAVGGLFCAGIAMMGGGIVALVAAIIAMLADVTLGMVALGAALIVLGLGMLFTFGMVCLFKPCMKMCTEFFKTIKASFGAEED